MIADIINKDKWQVQCVCALEQNEHTSAYNFVKPFYFGVRKVLWSWKQSAAYTDMSISMEQTDPAAVSSVWVYPLTQLKRYQSIIVAKQS